MTHHVQLVAQHAVQMVLVVALAVQRERFHLAERRVRPGDLHAGDGAPVLRATVGPPPVDAEKAAEMIKFGLPKDGRRSAE